ncbi:hypothetical protein COW94_01965 [Candidatus Peregrinibacteria bacterium CG22_combo_CG10-13_8_21_14_all_44_10]|nr:MAG: hypothetical protein AUK45_02455 [Candidatus Peregrinibacteria bacterium CG2_30_44_17]PIP66411.1 MAG: hypothetical protein COW94_01965 [Candidatus Peregrinibacteria bacterium CG22_combo_CG10-13_8_21_14_all_44_10]PIX79628.1 MAG: hypothetical protein COZ35_03175 [Candidatus Peregrinibacteria bacterium CG_4_10_14_3_um_filter_44_21]
MEDFQKEIEKLKARNREVEVNKAWETSITRRTILSLLTYIAIGAYLQAIQIPNPWLSAIVPAIAFMISTLALPYIKAIWLKIHKHEN